MDLSYRARVVLLSVSCVSLSGFAQQPTNPTPLTGQLQPAPPSDTAKRIVLDVVVTDRSGKAVQGLAEKDFAVLIDGHPQKVLSFEAVEAGNPAANPQPAGPPLKIILLVDEVNTNFQRVAYERDQIKTFLQQNGGVLAHPTSMAFLSDTGAEVQEATSRDGNALLATFDQHETGLRSIRRSQGFYGAVERFQLSLNALQGLVAKEAQTPGRKVVVWLSPGWPIFAGPQLDLTTKERTSLFVSIVAISTAMREARTTLYSVNPEGAGAAVGTQTFTYQEFLKPVKAAKNAQPGNLALEVLATQSGGLVLSPSNDIAALIARCAADTDAYYTLSVDAVPSDLPNAYHAIDVEIETPGLTARTGSGYYAQP